MHFVKKVLYVCILVNRLRCSSHFPLPRPSPYHTRMQPGQLRGPTPLTQPAKPGAVLHGVRDPNRLTGGVLQHQQLQPAGTGSRVWGRDPSATPSPPRCTCPPPLLHTACKQIKKIWSVTCSPFPLLPLASPTTEMHLLPTAIHCVCVCEPDLKIHDWLTPSSMEEIKCLYFQMPLPFESTHKATFCFPAVAALTTLMDLTAQTEMASQTLPWKKKKCGILNYSVFQVIRKD